MLNTVCFRLIFIQMNWGRSSPDRENLRWPPYHYHYWISRILIIIMPSTTCVRLIFIQMNCVRTILPGYGENSQTHTSISLLFPPNPNNFLITYDMAILFYRKWVLSTMTSSQWILLCLFSLRSYYRKTVRGFRDEEIPITYYILSL